MLTSDKPKVTVLWEQSPQPIKYTLPIICPKCDNLLQAGKIYVGIFPYIYTDFTLYCIGKDKHEFNFCFPYNPAMSMGYTVFDTEDYLPKRTERTCPFHKEQRLTPIRLYGNLTFSDGTKKIQLRCPKCFYSERATFKK